MLHISSRNLCLLGYILTHGKETEQGRWCQAVTTGPMKTHADYGIVDITSGTTTYYAFKTMRNMMLIYSKHVEHVTGLTNNDGYWVEKFQDASGNHLYVVFVPVRYDTAKGDPKSSAPSAQTATVNIGTGKTATITTMKGTQLDGSSQSLFGKYAMNDQIGMEVVFSW